MFLDCAVDTIHCDFDICVILEIHPSQHDNGPLTSVARFLNYSSHVWVDSDKPPVILGIISVQGRGFAVLVANSELNLWLFKC